MSAGEGEETLSSNRTSKEVQDLDAALTDVTLNERRWFLIDRAFSRVRRECLAEVAAEMLKDERERG